MLKILFFGAIVSIVIGLYNEKNPNGAIEGVAILVTFCIVTLIDAFNARKVEGKIQHRKQILDEKNS
jgi:hypothetical protein